VSTSASLLLERDAASELGRDLRLLDAARIHAFERLLFVNCGDGWIAEEAWRRGVKVYVCGLDASPDLVARATELRGVPGKLEFQTWDERRLPYSGGSFDKVFGVFTLRRAADAAAVLAEMRRVLEPGGELCLLECDPLAAALPRAGFSDVEELPVSDLPRERADDGMRVVVVRARALKC